MVNRRQLALAVGGVFVVALIAVISRDRAPELPPPPQRVAFHIVTGSTSGSNFRVGEVIAGVLSHPPGIGRCDTPERCGPEGVIVSTRATQGSVANINAVRSGGADSGLAEANVVALAVAGQPPFRREGPAQQLRTIARIYGEDLHLVAKRDADILGVSDLRGKRVSFAPEGSATNITARAVLEAYRLPLWRVRASNDALDAAAEKLRTGMLDAFFIVGGTPVNVITQLLEDDAAVLIPVDGAARTRLLSGQEHLQERTIPLGAYPGMPPTDTVGVGTLWITTAGQPEAPVYALVRGLFHPANRAQLDAGRIGFEFIDPRAAVRDPVAPLHPGAQRFFIEVGALPAAVRAAPP
jgi:TRAP transporter TAXI family solute receptor